MFEIDIEALQAEFDRIVASFGTPSDSFIEDTERWIEDNSIILQEINGGGGGLEKVFLTVTTFEDQNDGGDRNGLSLRDAILRAKADPSKEYVINLPAGVYELSIQGNEDSLFPSDNPNLPGEVDDIVARTGDLDVETRVTIVGVGSGSTTINGTALGDRIFDVREGGLLSLSGVTIEDGIAENALDENGSSGGGIRINTGASAIINNSIIKNNSTAINTDTDNNNGGGIANFGDTEIINSIISGNLSGDDAGGIYNEGTLNIRNSTIAGNFANAAAVEVIEAGGGGLYTFGGTVQILNSTISGNITGDAGGGILSQDATVSIINSTITNNSSQIGSGITVLGADNPLLLQNSIVAGNLDSSDIEGFFTENSSYNLIGDGNGIILDGFNNNIVGDIVNPLDPLLGDLQDNGGYTPTHLPLRGSPVINAGNNEIASSQVGNSDQRGYARIIGGTVDIGSTESGATPRSALNNPIYRFQNTEVPGTYLYVGEEERQSILNNYPKFEEEGFAFSVATQPGDGLIPIYRFQNTQIQGTYLYVGQDERQSILQSFPQFREEGLAFYAFGANANQADSLYRFQNDNLPGTYLFVGQNERQSILQNYSNFSEEGIAFEAAF